MFEPLVEVWEWLVSLVPTQFRFKRPHLNFIMVHYLYMVGLTIVGSIMLYPAGGMAYIDALFFAGGMATQSGLNTINVNDVNTYQQVVMMLLTCIATPIFINTVVVFVRLYWFEKRFKHIVKEIRNQRRSRTVSMTSRSRSQMQDEVPVPDLHRLELGVNGRSIKVLHETTVPNGMSGPPANLSSTQRQAAEKLGMEHLAESVTPSPERSHSNSSETARASLTRVSSDVAPGETEKSDLPSSDHQFNPPSPEHPRIRREITFADEVSPTATRTSELAHEPQNRDISKHIEFLERQQQNAKKGGALRIPGPRDFERGEVPEEVDDQDTVRRPRTKGSSYHQRGESRHGQDEDALNGGSHPVRRGITIDEPEHPGRRAREHDDGQQDDGDETNSTRLGRLKQTFARHRTNFSLGGGGDVNRSFARTFSTLTTARSREKIEEVSPYLSWEATTGRNSAFVGLTEQQREELGGIEYRSLKTLATILLWYYFGFHLLGLVVLTPWIVSTSPWREVVEANGQSPVWWGIFTPASMFNDLGFTLTADSMMSFQTAVLPLLLGSYLIVIGNTGFPCMLRFMIWAVSAVIPTSSALWEEVRFLLDHPRRCFTLLFPSRATWWLFWVLVLLNGIDLIFFIILDLNDPVVTTLSPGFRVLNGWFQAVSTRTAGFACVNLAGLHPGIQVSYLIMMYISVYPIAISVRRTNVYEERSLGIFGGEEDAPAEGEPSYVGQHLRRQLSFDLWFIFLGLFIITICEGDRIADPNQPDFTIFSVLFEIVSAYGTVGLSLGYPGIDASFSAEFGVISKLIIIAMMIRGRHRGLPYALDRAILLPSEKLQQKETQDAERRHTATTMRRGSAFAEANASQIDGWSQHELDASGLPRQYTGVSTGSADAITTVGVDPNITRRMARRNSAMSTASRHSKRERSRSLSRVIASGLSAGPTFSKHD